MRVALFATCLGDQLFPHVAVSSVKLLRHLGVDVDFPERQTCCGQPAYNAGYHQETRDIAKHHLDVFDGYDYVVLPSGSCGAMVRTHYPELFEQQPENYRRARDLGERTFELTTFVTEVLGRDDIGADLGGMNVTYHDSCHAMRFMQVKDAPRRLLKAAGADIAEAQGHDVCCGFGGLFSVKMPDISSAMAKAKIEGVVATEAPVLTSTDAGCLMQLQGTFHREKVDVKIEHVVDLLWKGVEKAQAKTAAAF
ncbi:MAG: (Fe-S)-binding protein [Trueperaceae bacterium]|nr:(Fe-S)-binding protein [Trueperaceae bacterium]